MEIKVTNNKERTHVRYAVKYKERNYEYCLHSLKKHFIRNLADVVNILEYCVTQDLKQNLYKPDKNLYTFSVERLVNDKPDENFNKEWFCGAISAIVAQMIDDNVQRNS
jgi:hypothetical protein